MTEFIDVPEDDFDEEWDETLERLFKESESLGFPSTILWECT